MQHRLNVLLTATGLLASITAGAAAQDASPGAQVYRLSATSTYQSGCFPPCLCPLLTQAPLRGTFTLIASGVDGEFTTFSVRDVSWTVSVGTVERRLAGSGTYKIGGEVAVMQQLELDLVIDGDAVRHFDSRLVAADSVPFPALSVTVSNNHMVCHDTVLVVEAAVAPCIGDCDGDGVVTVAEIITGVEMALQGAAVDPCPAFNCNASGLGVSVNCVVEAVGNALTGCVAPAVSPQGACCFGDCTTGTTNCMPWTQDACCICAWHCEIPTTIWWCPPDQYDPAAHHCTACVNPCLEQPPTDSAPTPTGEREPADRSTRP